MEAIHEIINHTLLITGFVFTMMLLIEYLNVLTHGSWQSKIKNSRFGQILFGVLFGMIPGCLGSFTIVSLYSHGVISFGALTATMIATSGDEAYVMFSMFPQKAIWIVLSLGLIGFVVGVITDILFKKQQHFLKNAHDLELHTNEWCDCSPSWTNLKRNFKSVSFPRALLVSILLLLGISVLVGITADHEEEWVKTTLIIVSLIALFVVSVVPEHFLEEHLWKHVLKKHLLRIFLWTLATLTVVYFVQEFIDVNSWIEQNYILVLLIAVLIGIIPESGPHLVFVTLFASGSLPLGILMASSIVQDGHGTLPLIAFSKKSFIVLKIINIAVGFAFGLIFLLFESVV